MYRVYNFTKIRSRDKKLYSFGDIKISSTGVSTTYLGIAAVCFVIFQIVGILICVAAGTNFYYPMSPNGSFDGNYLMFFLAAPFGLAMFLNSAKIQKYRAIDFVRIYIKPKHPINKNRKRIKNKAAKYNGFVELIER